MKRALTGGLAGVAGRVDALHEARDAVGGVVVVQHAALLHAARAQPVHAQLALRAHVRLQAVSHSMVLS